MTGGAVVDPLSTCPLSRPLSEVRVQTLRQPGGKWVPVARTGRAKGLRPSCAGGRARRPRTGTETAGRLWPRWEEEAGARSDSTCKSPLAGGTANIHEPNREGGTWCDEFSPSAHASNALRWKDCVLLSAVSKDARKGPGAVVYILKETFSHWSIQSNPKTLLNGTQYLRETKKHFLL